MAINLPAGWESSTPKAFWNIFALEAGQGKLPVSTKLMGGCVAAYFVAQTALHLLEHGLVSSLMFGLGSAGLLAGLTAGVLELYKSREKTIQAITALAASGAVIALSSIILHFIFAVALPPPLPTQRLVASCCFQSQYGMSSASPGFIATRRSGRSRLSLSRRLSSSWSISSWPR